MVGDYRKAADNLELATIQSPTDGNAFALRAVSLSRLSKNETDSEKRVSLEILAYQSWEDANSISNNRQHMESFLKYEPSLRDIVEENAN